MASCPEGAHPAPGTNAGSGAGIGTGPESGIDPGRRSARPAPRRARLEWVCAALLCALLPAALLPQAAAAEATDDRVLIEVSADPETPYVQARVQYRVRILARVPLRQATLSEPAVDGANIRRIGPDQRRSESRDGQRYQVLERLYAIVPHAVGTLHISGPRLSVAVPTAETDSAPAASRLIERRETIYPASPDLTLEVKPPPAAAEAPWLPAEAVSISEDWQPRGNELHIGVPLTRRIRIEAAGVGSGQLPEIEFGKLDGFRVYGTRTERHEEVSGDDLLASATRTITYVPTQPGTREVPGLRIPWWSLGLDAPRQAALGARTVQVVGADAAVAPPGAAAAPLSARLTSAAGDDLWQGPGLTLFFALAWLVTLGLWWRERRRRGSAPVAPMHSVNRAPAADLAQSRTDLERACRAGQPAAARAALLAWGAQRWPQRPPRGPEDLLVRLGADAAARAAVRQLEACLWGQTPGSGSGTTDPDWDGTGCLDALVPWLHDHATSTADVAALAPLYPAETGLKQT